MVELPVLEAAFLVMLYVLQPGLPAETSVVRSVATIAECQEIGGESVQAALREREGAAVFYGCLPVVGMQPS